ncbi:competence type IV pilus assembly protein ComGB [Sporosarcina sp. CAU 1771]
MNKSNRLNKTDLINRSSFLARLAVLLKEGFTFHDALNLLLPHHVKEYEEALFKVDKCFREGFGVSHILNTIGFPPGLLLPISLAEADGRLPEALNGLAIRLKKRDDAREKVKSLLAYPITLFIFITLLLLAFRRYFLPNMEALATSRTTGEEGIISRIPALVSKLPDLILGTGIIFGIVGFSLYLMYKKYTPEKKIRIMIQIPLVAQVYKELKTKTFSSELGSLLQSGLSIQEALDVLIAQRLDLVLSEIAKNVKESIVYGEPFHSAVALTPGLTKQFTGFAEHGATSGHLAKELIIYSEHLDETIDGKIAKGLAVLQPALFSLIALCILAAYLALLLPVYGMIEKY